MAAHLRVEVPPDFAAWRELARKALLHDIPPESIDFADDTIATDGNLFGTDEPAFLQEAAPVDAATPHVPRMFLEKATIASYHREPQRWNLFYRLLWRLQTERNLMHLSVDSDVNALLRLDKQVRYDEHKMHAFVRFRRVMDGDGEHFISWYEPQHRILQLAAPFFGNASR